jgi:hypothetical protein
MVTKEKLSCSDAAKRRQEAAAKKIAPAAIID